MWAKGNRMWALEISSRSWREEDGNPAHYEHSKSKILGTGSRSLTLLVTQPQSSWAQAGLPRETSQGPSQHGTECVRLVTGRVLRATGA